MQHALLPDGEVRSGQCVCMGTYKAAAEVGGDYYDIFELRDGKLGLVIADVSGKGLAGCLVTSMLAVLIRSRRDQHTSPRELLIDLEKGLLTTLARGTFVTVFYGILDPGSGRLMFASAAHSPLAVYRADRREVEWFFTKGIPLGAMRSGVMAATLQDQEVILAPGDVALQFTDGLNEAWNPREKRFFDFEGIAAHLQASGRRGGHAVQAELLPLVEAWTHPDPLGDDFTLLTVERTASPVATGPKHGDPLAFQIETGQGRARLEEMLSGTLHLQLPSQMDALIRLREWVNTCLDGHGSLTEHKELIEGSLFEVCANIIEHGYGNEPDQDIDLWWVPLPGGLQTWSSLEGSAHADEESAEAHRDGVGYFVICDQGSPFDPTSWTPPDLDDPSIRRRGRGLGWQIIYSSMKKVVYESHTPAGNLTLLRFDPAMHAVR
jgi:anti-sigma regulatory factor (Ser/Thr protein kinase)